MIFKKMVYLFAALLLCLIFCDFSFAGNNLLINPDAETGLLDGWTDLDELWSADTAVTPHGGKYFFWPSRGDVPNTSIYQDVDVSAFIQDINDGKAYFHLSGWLANYDQYPHDRSTLAIECLDSNGRQLSYLSRSHRSPTWTFYQIENQIPMGTSTLRVYLIATRFVGSDNDGYFDDLSLEIDDSAPAVTVTVASADGTNEIVEGGELKLSATSSDSADTSFTWTSSFEAVASVDENGLVSAHRTGRALIQAEGTTTHTIGSFEIVIYSSDYVIFTNPQTGAKWASTTNQNISWEVKGTPVSGQLFFSTNGGVDWTKIVDIPDLNSGQYSWLIPSFSDIMNNCVIKMSWSGGEAESSGFTIFTADQPDEHTRIFQPGPGVNNGDDGSINAGKDAYFYSCNGAWSGSEEYITGNARSTCNQCNAKAYIQFNLSTLPDNVNKVYLGVTHSAHTAYCYSMCEADFYFYPILTAWNEMSLPLTPPEEGDSIYGPLHIQFPNDFGNKEYDITEIYRQWKSGKIANNGLAIYSPDQGCNNAAVQWTVYSSDSSEPAKRPYLKIIEGNSNSNSCPITINQDLSFAINGLYDAGPPFGEIALKVDFKYFDQQNDKILWQLGNIDTSSPAASCSISIAPDLSFTLKDAVYDAGPLTGQMNLQMEFKYYGEQNGSTLWYLANLINNNSTPPSADCTSSISSSSGFFSVNGGTKTVSIDASDSSCDWSVSNDLSWVSVSPTSGKGSGTVTINVDAHNSTSNRTGNITIAGKTYSINQYTTNSLGMSFAGIPSGTFTMGSPEDERGRDGATGRETQHQVTLTQGYYMQTTEVTQGQWEAVMGSNPSFWHTCGDNCPVEQVSWDEAQSFITQMNMRGEGTYALPTEAQWEYAARAGSTTALANGDITEQYNDDPNLDVMGWYDFNSTKTHPVGLKQANAWGLYDIYGNVMEWCEDWDGPYLADPATDPKGPSSGNGRILRGGDWDKAPKDCRSAARDHWYQDKGYSSTGFRLVLIPDKQF